MRAGRTRKHCQLYRSYGDLDNERLMMHYKIARMANPADRVRVALALEDGVGLLGRAKATMMTRWAALRRGR